MPVIVDDFFMMTNASASIQKTARMFWWQMTMNNQSTDSPVVDKCCNFVLSFRRQDGQTWTLGWWIMLRLCRLSPAHDPSFKMYRMIIETDLCNAYLRTCCYAYLHHGSWRRGPTFQIIGWYFRISASTQQLMWRTLCNNPCRWQSPNNQHGSITSVLSSDIWHSPFGEYHVKGNSHPESSTCCLLPLVYPSPGSPDLIMSP